MPKIGKYDAVLKTVFYLYPSKADAEAGHPIGGTGFLVAVPSRRWGGRILHIHGVTNKHVAVTNPEGPSCPVIRVYRKTGQPEFFELDPSKWIFKPNGPDVAVSPPLPMNHAFDNNWLDINSWFMTAEEEKNSEIGPADDVFMVGRFVDYEGFETNEAALRFGHISITNAKIAQLTGYVGRSIVIDMHSRTGFSGSPVFVYRTLGSFFLDPQPPNTFLTGGGHLMKLLGIHWGQFPEHWEIKNGKPVDVDKNASLITEGSYVKGLSGMTCVVPSSEVRDLILNASELVEMREQREQQIDKEIGPRLNADVVPEGAVRATLSSPPEANPDHKGDFTRLLNAAAKTKKQGE